jgi:hypothetical protein
MDDHIEIPSKECSKTEIVDAVARDCIKTLKKTTGVNFNTAILIMLGSLLRIRKELLRREKLTGLVGYKEESEYNEMLFLRIAEILENTGELHITEDILNDWTIECGDDTFISNIKTNKVN